MVATLLIVSGCCKKTDHKKYLPPVQSNQVIHEDNEVQDVKIQGMISDMVIMTGTQMGSSLANSLVGQQATALANRVTQENQTMQANIKSFQSKAQLDQQSKLQALMNSFSTAQQNVAAQTTFAENASNAEIDYLHKNISLNQPQQEYIFDQVQFDQLFSLGTMLTPTGASWKNPFAVGDWEYDSTDNSFWQHQNSPIFVSTTDSSGAITSSSDQAENNAIFSEYITNLDSYTVAGQIEIYQVAYPFFAGIIINKARWISGDYEALRKCRMVGIYGKSASDIGIYTAQQYTMTDDQLKAAHSNSPIQTAFDQILQGTVTQQIKIDPAIFKNIVSNSILYNFEIITSPKSLSINFWQGDTKNTPIIINNLDATIYTYHGIGFICPGAIARFSLKQPFDLIFSDQAIEKYKD